ncbi:MAG TPA: hypothetical protein VMZ03_09595 [Chitinophagaceae bacterium]|nr:hypothetical protein [Chitinophagaceae bacterium]
MKKILFVLFTLAAVTVEAQTVDEVIQHYTKGMGGLDAFNKVTSARITGTYSTQGNDFPFTIQVLNGKGMRTDVEAMGQFVTNVYFNGNGWKINPFAGATTATDVTGTELNDFRLQSSLASQLMDYKARGDQAELLGKEMIEGVETYKIKLTNKDDGKATTYFIGTNDHVLIKSIISREMQGQETEVESYYSGLKEIGGIKFFMTRDSRIGGQTFQTVTFEKVELNVPIDEKIFNK